MRATSGARPSPVDLPLDPPRRRLQHGVAGRAAEGGVDRVVAADREQQRPARPLASPPSCSASQARAARPSRRPVSGSRPLAARRRIGLGAADDVAALAAGGHGGRSAPSARHGRRRSPRRWRAAGRSRSRAARRPSGSSLRNRSIRLIRRPSSSPSPAWRASAGLSSTVREPGCQRQEADPDSSPPRPRTRRRRPARHGGGRTAARGATAAR